MPMWLAGLNAWLVVISNQLNATVYRHVKPSASLKGPSHIQNGARPTSLRAKKRIFARMTAGVCSITAGSAAIFRDRPAFAGHRNLFLIQRFSNGRISDLRNMTCTNFRCPIYARSGRWAEPARASPGCRAGVDRWFTNYRPKLGRRPPLYRPGFARLPIVYWRAPGDFWSLVFEGHRPSPVQNVRSTPWRIWNSATFGRSTISAGDRWICDVGISRKAIFAKNKQTNKSRT